MNVLPMGRKQWFYLSLRLCILIVALALGAGIMTEMPGRSYSGSFEALSDDEQAIRDNLYRHISIIAGSIGERNMVRYRELEQTADYITSCFEAEGYAVHDQRFLSGNRAVSNLVTQISSSDDSTATLIVGAHYDSARGSPGANDNATGVAALLELARLLKGSSLRLRVQLVAFVNEEPPYFQTESMGSRQYAVLASGLNQRIAWMVALETLGCYYSSPGSQQYPFGIGLFYPSRGDFVGFVGNLSSRSMVRRSIDAFRRAEHPLRRNRRSGVVHRDRLVRSLVVLEAGHPFDNDYRHRAVSLPVLSFERGHAGQSRLRKSCACRNRHRSCNNRRADEDHDKLCRADACPPLFRGSYAAATADAG